jgi:hypothetical protein
MENEKTPVSKVHKYIITLPLSLLYTVDKIEGCGIAKKYINKFMGISGYVYCHAVSLPLVCTTAAYI